MHNEIAKHRYRSWLERESGQYAMNRSQGLLRELLSGWPRRARSMLVFNAGSGEFIETLWEAGFDVTGQDSDPDFLSKARELLGKRAEFVLSSPDHLPFDDCAFDYAVAAAAMEFWEQPEAVLREIDRLACSGVILIFPNSWSMFGLECRLRKKHPLCSSALPLLKNPRSVLKLARRVFGKKKTAWASILPGPSFTWAQRRIFFPLNAPQIPLPLGAVAGLRIDFGPVYTGTPLVVQTAKAVPGNQALTKSSVRIDAP